MNFYQLLSLIDMKLVYTALEIAVMVGIVGFLYLAIYLLYSENTGLFHRMRFDQRMVYLVMLGGLMGATANLPIIVKSNSIMAINIGGAIIPVSLSLYFIYLERDSLARVAMYISGVIVVGVLTYSITSFVPSMGVVVGFPNFALPSVVGAVLAIALFRRDISHSGPYAYSVSTLGVFFGADIVRIPLIMSYGERAGGFMGSIGGAGIMDMVFISGLMALVFVLPTARKEDWNAPQQQKRVDIEKIVDTRSTLVMKYLGQNRDRDAAMEALKILDLKLQELAHLYNAPPHALNGDKWQIRVMEHLAVERPIIDDYITARKNILSGRGDQMKHIYTVRSIIEYLKRFEKRFIAPVEKRVVAFVIDFIIMGVILAIPAFYLILSGNLGGTAFATLFLSLSVIDIVYFTVFETLWGQTPGKKMMGIKVVRSDYTPVDFIDALGRNVYRKIDQALFYYIIPLALMISDYRARRIGDRLAGTVVIDLSGPPPVYTAYPQMVPYTPSPMYYYPPAPTAVPAPPPPPPPQQPVN